jgi:hypothetical protein
MLDCNVLPSLPYSAKQAIALSHHDELLFDDGMLLHFVFMCVYVCVYVYI